MQLFPSANTNIMLPPCITILWHLVHIRSVSCKVHKIQKCFINLSRLLGTFLVKKGIQRGEVLSPVPFCLHKQVGKAGIIRGRVLAISSWVQSAIAGDMALMAPSLKAMQQLSHVCEEFASCFISVKCNTFVRK